jgi:hypothetical protein
VGDENDETKSAIATVFFARHRLNASLSPKLLLRCSFARTVRQTLDERPRCIEFLRKGQEAGAAGGSSAMLLLGHCFRFFSRVKK